LPGDDQCAGRRGMADHGHQFHPHAPAAPGRRRGEAGPGILRLDLRQRRRPGRCARLCAAAGRAGTANRSPLGRQPSLLKNPRPPGNLLARTQVRAFFALVSTPLGICHRDVTKKPSHCGMKTTSRLAIIALAAALALAACKPADSNQQVAGDRIAAEITGAGATFIYPLVSKWSVDYNKATGHKINYQSIGSGGGIAQIKAGTVDFGSTDKPLPSEELAEAGLIQFPSAIGGVVPVVNIEGIGSGQLRLTGPVIADIYLGTITSWNDPAIADLNPGVTLPASKINVVHRSDGSGTTYNSVNYLSKVSPRWKDRVGEGT